ncbi:hypothetical protein QBC44DRAFT_310715 [Cladorrhinum sp. PSN332]|nr:hypothetical protein QBC44DRAFT_310715 [Cladorrhinum sp. PSN332]
MHLLSEFLLFLISGRALAAPAATGLPYSKTKTLPMGCHCLGEPGVECPAELYQILCTPVPEDPLFVDLKRFPTCCFDPGDPCALEEEWICPPPPPPPLPPSLSGVKDSTTVNTHHSLELKGRPSCCYRPDKPCPDLLQGLCNFPLPIGDSEMSSKQHKPRSDKIIPNKESCTPCRFYHYLFSKKDCGCNSPNDESRGQVQLEPRQEAPTATVTIVRPVDTTLATTTITLTVPSVVSIAPSAIIAVPLTVTVPTVVLVSPTATPIPIGNFTVSAGNFTVFLNATAPSASAVFTIPPSQAPPVTDITLPTLSATPIILTTIAPAPPAPIVLSTITVTPEMLTPGALTTIPFVPPVSTVTAPAPAGSGSFSTITLPSIPATTITISLPTAQTVTVGQGWTINPALSTAVITLSTSTITLPTVTITLNTAAPPPSSANPVTITWSPILPTFPVPATVTITPSIIPLAGSTVTLIPAIPSTSTAPIQAPPLASVPFGSISPVWTPPSPTVVPVGAGRTVTLLETLSGQTVTSLVVIPDGTQTGGAATEDVSPWWSPTGTEAWWTTMTVTSTISFPVPSVSTPPVVQGIVTTVTVDALQGWTETVYVTVTGLQVDVGPTQTFTADSPASVVTVYQGASTLTFEGLDIGHRYGKGKEMR